MRLWVILLLSSLASAQLRPFGVTAVSAPVSNILLTQIANSPFTLSAAAAAVAGATAYTGTITGGGTNTDINFMAVISGFANAVNNGTFMVTASAVGTLTVSNPNGVLETHAGTATVYQSKACNNGITGTSYACLMNSSATGGTAIVGENDADNPAGAAGVPTCSGCTFVADGNFLNGASGHMNWFHSTVLPAGATSITINSTSGHSSANVRIYTGLSGALDVISAAETTNASSSILTTAPLTTTQTDLSLGWCKEGITTAAGMSPRGVWANGTDFPQPNDGTDTFVADVQNAVLSQFMATMSATSTQSYACGVVSYKSAVTGSAPTGNSPAFWVNGAGNANSTAASVANMQTGTYGGYTWVLTGSGGQTWTTACHHALSNNVTVNGVTYTPGTDPGTTGLSYVMDTNPATAFEAFNLPATGVASFVMSGWYFTPTFQTDAQRYAPAVIGDVGGTDEVDMGVRLGLIKVESNTNSSAGQAFADGVWGAFSMKYVNGGPFLMTLYDSTGASLGQQSATATSTANALTYWLGNQAAFGGTNATNQCLSNIEFGGAYPSLP